jgi:hypothetical protein
MGEIKAGDIIAFSGADWVSDGINLATFGIPRVSIHHVGIVAKLHNDPLLYEAIGAEGTRPTPCVRQGRVTAGFQCHWLREIVETVKGQKIYHLPLRRPLYHHEESRLTEYLDSMVGRPYDKLGAMRSGGFVFRTLQAFMRPEDLAGIFCSESCMATISHVGLVNTRSAGKWNPNSLTRYLRWTGLYGDYRRLV